jgi:hypothetical protein
VFEHAQRVRARVGAAAGWRLERRATIDEAERQLLADARRLAGRG